MIALVTGGSRGLGRSVASTFRALGWKVRTPKRQTLDMEDEGSVELFLGENPTPDVAVFCHGTWYSDPGLDVAQWVSQYKSRVVFPAVMIAHWLGKPGLRAVTMVSSTRGFIGGAYTAPYSQACAAQIAMMLGYSREIEECRFNVVCPGLTDTDMAKDVVATGGASKEAVPQPVASVADAVISTILFEENGLVLRVVDGEVSRVKWVWEEEYVGNNQ